MWKGEIKEGRSRRSVALSLTFNLGGSIVGSGGQERCTLEGSFHSGGEKHYHVKWVEVYDWGRLEVTGQLFVKNLQDAHIEGDFSASDGGKGQLHLTFQ